MKVLEFEIDTDETVLIRAGHVVSIESQYEGSCLLTVTNGRAFRVKGSLEEIKAKLEVVNA